MKVLHNAKFPTTVYFVEEDSSLDMLDSKVANYAQEVQGFKGAYRSSFIDLGPNASNTILVGLGKESEIHRNKIRITAFDLGLMLEEHGIKEASIKVASHADIPEKSVGQCTVEGLVQSTYRFENYKSKKSNGKLTTLGILSNATDQEAIDEAIHITNGAHVSRDLVNLRANNLTPKVFEDKVLSLFADLPVTVKSYGPKEIQELGMEALLTVAKGSVEEPRFIVLEYLPKGGDESALTLVGKGMTYDAGGYALKPAKSMVNMHIDMAGAGAVVGAINALANQKVEKNVIGLIPLAENLISEKAMKNGDIIYTLKGSSVEVNNTDAEGRLILADAIYYAATAINSSAIIDIATLTGAAISTFGDKTAAVMTNETKLLDQVLAMSEMTGESMWQLPRLEEMYEKVKGKFADLNNAPGGGGGTITAGLFLEHFVEDKPWVHIDIAGPAWADQPYDYYKQGATGFPVKTLYNFAKRY